MIQGLKSRDTISHSMKPFMTSLLLFSMAMGINDRQDKDDCAGRDHYYKKRAVLPQQRNKVANI